jgi:Ca2+-binding RTX toxin-like protein
MTVCIISREKRRMKRVFSVIMVFLLCLSMFSIFPLCVHAPVAVVLARLPSARTQSASIWDGNNAYVFGGSDASGPMNQILKYNPASDSVSVMSAVLPYPAVDLCAVWSGQYAYIFGGAIYSPPFTHMIARYDPSSDSMTLISNTFSLYSMSAVWAGNCAYLFGGYDGYAYYDSILKFDPTSNQVTTMSARLPTPSKWSSAVWTGNYAYVFGGNQYYDTPTNQILRYDPTTDTITTIIAGLPQKVFFTSAVWTGAYAYIFGGNLDPSGTVTDKIFQFDPASETSTTVKEALPSARRGTSAVWNGQCAFIFGGDTWPPQAFLNEIVKFSPDIGPVAYWKFDEGSGNIASDSSGNGNNGMIHTATWTDGIVGRALHFNGVDSWVEVPNSPTLTGLSQITVEAWIQEDSIPSRPNGIISKCDGWAPPTNAEYFLGTVDSGRVFFETDHSTAIFSATTTQLITQVGKWYHVAGTWSGDTYTIYVDGTPVLSGTCTPQTTLSNTLPVQIGRHGTWPWTYFQGIIDEVKIYNHARTADEILSDYNSLVPNSPPSIPTIPNVVQGGQIFQKGQLLDFTTSATDPDGDKIIITFDWGDGTYDATQLLSSPATVTLDHVWTSTGMYEVRAQATDTKLAQSSWSAPLEITVVTDYITANKDGNNNWAGYMVRSTTLGITSVEGRWYVPAFGTNTASTNAIWVGIGGNGGSLLQVGVEAVTQPSTETTQYCAFWESVAGGVGLPNSDNPSKSHCWIFSGDEIDASIIQLVNGNWQIQISDLTRVWTLTWTSYFYAGPDQTSAEWILELGAGSFGGSSDLPLSFGTVEFGSATVSIGSTNYEMGLAGHTLATQLWDCKCFRDDVQISETSPIQNYNCFEISDTHWRPLSGNKQMKLTGSNNVVVITSGNNVIDAKGATDTTVIKKGVGNDIINLGGGHNIVTETAGGNDKITTGNGDNTITITGNGNYQITTGTGNDQIQITGNGNSIINAGDGNNAVTVLGKGNNQITTGSGNDLVVAGNGNNIIKTGAGNDGITVGNGNNNIDGGTGYDICIHGTGHNTILNCEKT